MLNVLSHATNARMTESKTASNSGRAHAQNRQVRVNSLVRIANPLTVYVRATQDERHARNIASCSYPGIAVLAVLVSSHVLQATPHIVGLIPSVLGTRTLWS